MNVLLVDRDGSFLDMALRCKDAGHEVRWYIAPKPNGDRPGVGDGLGLRIHNYHQSLNWADIVLCSDNTWYMEDLAGYKAKGFPIMLGTPEAAELELARSKGLAMLRALEQSCFVDLAQGHVRNSLVRPRTPSSKEREVLFSNVIHVCLSKITLMENVTCSISVRFRVSLKIDLKPSPGFGSKHRT